LPPLDWKKSHEAPPGVHYDPYDNKIPREDLVKLAANAGLQLDAEFLYQKYQQFLRFRKPQP
jgi:hypothetical protein